MENRGRQVSNHGKNLFSVSTRVHAGLLFKCIMSMNNQEICSCLIQEHTKIAQILLDLRPDVDTSINEFTGLCPVTLCGPSTFPVEPLVLKPLNPNPCLRQACTNGLTCALCIPVQLL